MCDEDDIEVKLMRRYWEKVAKEEKEEQEKGIPIPSLSARA